MNFKQYVKSRGLRPALIAQQMGVTRQCIEQYGDHRVPTAKTLKKISEAMTALGAPTTVVDLVKVFYE